MIFLPELFIRHSEWSALEVKTAGGKTTKAGAGDMFLWDGKQVRTSHSMQAESRSPKGPTLKDFIVLEWSSPPQMRVSIISKLPENAYWVNAGNEDTVDHKACISPLGT